ncbi:GNAT family N-acetyltransferase [Paenibacillus turpanensis]|uniref:GNAT family N-acetyltransferase n=1 Tax=Paenibacillus turpanensis TaxID=2689078 RepID=UPI00140940E4|nr:GNAT family N-acetyltransferase [Paenibacillus turpanensis]
MKIAFDCQAPVREQLDALLTNSGIEAEMAKPGTAPKHIECVISAYDQGRLVGVGSLLDDGSIEIVVAREYRHRAISEPLGKLLTARSKAAVKVTS